MGTHSKTTVFDEDNKPLLSFYRQFDGYFEGHGQQVADWLKDIVIVNGFSGTPPKHAANGMGCLAAQLIAELKEAIGNIYIINTEGEEEYNYEIRFLKGKETCRVRFVGRHGNNTKEFSLYGDIDTSADVTHNVTFVYDKCDASVPSWRTVGVTLDDGERIYGYENEKFKSFLKSRIIGGRILRVQ